jgi:hypothetical protein
MWRTGLGVCKCSASRSPHSSAAAGRSGIRGLLGSSGRRNPPGGKLRGFTVLGEPGVADSHLGPGASLGPDGLGCGPGVFPGGAGTVGSQTVAQAACWVAESRGGAGGGVQAWWLHGTPAVPSPASRCRLMNTPLRRTLKQPDPGQTDEISHPKRASAKKRPILEQPPGTVWSSCSGGWNLRSMGLKSAWSHVFTRRSKLLRDCCNARRWPGVLPSHSHQGLAFQPTSGRRSKLSADAPGPRLGPRCEAMLKGGCSSKSLGGSCRGQETGRLA